MSEASPMQQIATELRKLSLLAQQHADAITNAFVDAQLTDGPEASTFRILLESMARTAFAMKTALEQTAARADSAVEKSAAHDSAWRVSP